MFPIRRSPGGLQRSGFTLVEMLVVITIIGILIGLLLPAVNAARESARNADCKNKLSNLGKACMAHEQAQEIFPTGGWGALWVGDPDRGYGTQQPGGWLYNILPHTDLIALHDLGRFGSSNAGTVQQLVSNPWPLVSCPTRHRPALANFAGTIANNCGGVAVSASANPAFQVARTDYAANCGDAALNQYGPGPTDESAAAQNTYFGARITPGLGAFTTCRGICFELSTMRKDDVKDGCSQTILAGEKYLAPNCYGMGAAGSGCDTGNLYEGMSSDVLRTTFQAPMQDRLGVTNIVTDTLGKPNVVAFGSSHPNAANFVFCDGSTLSINYLVNPETFRRLGTRAEGMPVDMSTL